MDCVQPGCTNPVKVKARQLCERHYSQFRRLGVIGDPQPRQCANCSELFTPKRNGVAKYCSERCNNAALRLQRRYGITPQEFDDLLIHQGHRCPICLKQITRANAVVDHDHACCPDDRTRNGRQSCGKCIRALLCRTCNHMIGLAHEEIETLQRAAQYVQYKPHLEQENRQLLQWFGIRQ